VYDRALRHIGATPDFVPPEFERVRFSHQQRASTEPGRQPLTLDERRALWAYFADDVARLEQMLGRDLSAWDPGSPAASARRRVARRELRRERRDAAVALPQGLARPDDIGPRTREQLAVDRRTQPTPREQVGDRGRQRIEVDRAVVPHLPREVEQRV